MQAAVSALIRGQNAKSVMVTSAYLAMAAIPAMGSPEPCLSKLLSPCKLELNTTANYMQTNKEANQEAALVVGFQPVGRDRWWRCQGPLMSVSVRPQVAFLQEMPWVQGLPKQVPGA